LSNQGDGDTEATERVSALVDTASNAPLKTDASYRERHEAAGVLLRAAEEATFAEARSYTSKCESCAAASDVFKDAAHLTDQCAHCSACVLAETPDTGCWSITAPSSVPCSALVGLDEGGYSDVT
jgi:hypothetical protein